MYTPTIKFEVTRLMMKDGDGGMCSREDEYFFEEGEDGILHPVMCLDRGLIYEARNYKNNSKTTIETLNQYLEEYYHHNLIQLTHSDIDPEKYGYAIYENQLKNQTAKVLQDRDDLHIDDAKTFVVSRPDRYGDVTPLCNLAYVLCDYLMPRWIAPRLMPEDVKRFQNFGYTPMELNEKNIIDSLLTPINTRIQ